MSTRERIREAICSPMCTGHERAVDRIMKVIEPLEELVRCKTPARITEATLCELRSMAAGETPWVTLDTYNKLKRDYKTLVKTIRIANDKPERRGFFSRLFGES